MTKSVLSQLPGIKPANPADIKKLLDAMQIHVVDKFHQREREKLARKLQMK